MGLLQNITIYNENPVSNRGGLTLTERSTFNKNETNLNKYTCISPTGATPSGYTPPYCWLMAKSSGGLAAHGAIIGDGEVTFGNLEIGRASCRERV